MTISQSKYAAATALLLLSALSALTGCATNGAQSPSAQAAASTTPAPVGQRDLSAQEKKVIVDAISPSLRNPGAAKYKWAKFPAVVTEESVNYCATVDAQSPYAAYNGHQAYIVEAHMSGGQVTSAVLGLIAGGKDFALVSNMCAKYGLDPKTAS